MWRPRNALCVKKEEEATGSVLSLAYVRASLARCERTTGIAAVANLLVYLVEFNYSIRRIATAIADCSSLAPCTVSYVHYTLCARERL